jgi:hypothetical protein
MAPLLAIALIATILIAAANSRAQGRTPIVPPVNPNIPPITPGEVFTNDDGVRLLARAYGLCPERREEIDDIGYQFGVDLFEPGQNAIANLVGRLETICPAAVNATVVNPGFIV